MTSARAWKDADIDLGKCSATNRWNLWEWHRWCQCSEQGKGRCTHLIDSHLVGDVDEKRNAVSGKSPARNKAWLAFKIQQMSLPVVTVESLSGSSFCVCCLPTASWLVQIRSSSKVAAVRSASSHRWGHRLSQPLAAVFSRYEPECLRIWWDKGEVSRYVDGTS